MVVDWDAIRRSSFVHEDGCWHTCNGGFCCSNEHPDFEFQLHPRSWNDAPLHGGRVPLPRAGGRRAGARRARLTPNRIALDFGGPRPLALVHTPCRLLGLCKGVIDKPLLCRLYPFVPVLGLDGSLEDLVPASIFELTFDLIGSPTPCTVRAKRQEYFERWRANDDRLAVLRHPYVILFLQAAKHFAALYAERLAADPTLRGLSGRSFWKRWEFEYLSGQLLNVAGVRRPGPRDPRRARGPARRVPRAPRRRRGGRVSVVTADRLLAFMKTSLRLRKFDRTFAFSRKGA